MVRRRKIWEVPEIYFKEVNFSKKEEKMRRLLVVGFMVALLLSLAITPALAVATKIVKYARCGWVEAENPIDQMIAIYNSLPERQKDGVMIVSDPAGKGSTDPILVQMRKDGNMLWNGTLGNAPFFQMAVEVSLDNTQPIEPYAEKSQYKEAWARIKAGYIPSVWADDTYQGKLMAIAHNVDCVAFVYRSDFLEKVGYTTAPNTWDQVFDAAKKVQVAYFKDKISGFQFDPNATHQWLMAVHQVFSPPNKLFTADGYMNVADPGWKAAMELSKKFIDEGLVPKAWDVTEPSVPWKMQKLAMFVSMHAKGIWGARIWGFDKLRIAPIPLGPGMTKGGTMFWSDTFVLYNGAPYPQEMVDFIVWLMDPLNDQGFGRLTFKSGKISPLFPVYDQLNKDDVTENWAFGVRDALAGATAPVKGLYALAAWGDIPAAFIPYLKGEISIDESVNRMVAAFDKVRKEAAKK